MRSHGMMHIFRPPTGLHWAHRAVISATARLSCCFGQAYSKASKLQHGK